MLSTSYPKLEIDLSRKRLQYIHIFTTSTTTATANLFTVPAGLRFYPVKFLFYNYSGNVQLSAKFTGNSEYQATRSSVYTTSNLAGTFKELAIQAQTTTRLWLTPGTIFTMEWSSSSVGTSVIKVFIDGYLV